MEYVKNAPGTVIAHHVAEVFSAINLEPATSQNKIVVMYNNDNYRYAFDTATNMFCVIGPNYNILYMSHNPVKARTQYEIYIGLAFQRRISARGYSVTGIKNE